MLVTININIKENYYKFVGNRVHQITDITLLL